MVGKYWQKVSKNCKGQENDRDYDTRVPKLYVKFFLKVDKKVPCVVCPTPAKLSRCNGTVQLIFFAGQAICTAIFHDKWILIKKKIFHDKWHSREQKGS